MLVGHLGQGIVTIADGAVTYHEANLLQLNCEKAHHLLGWHPRWGVDKSVEATAAWYRHYLDGSDIEEISSAQIFEFFPELT